MAENTVDNTFLERLELKRVAQDPYERGDKYTVNFSGADISAMLFISHCWGLESSGEGVYDIMVDMALGILENKFDEPYVNPLEGGSFIYNGGTIKEWPTGCVIKNPNVFNRAINRFEGERATPPFLTKYAVGLLADSFVCSLDGINVYPGYHNHIQLEQMVWNLEGFGLTYYARALTQFREMDPDKRRFKFTDPKEIGYDCVPAFRLEESRVEF